MDLPNLLSFPIPPNDSPQITVKIAGAKDGVEVLAIVDTGFTGFAQIPLAVGIRAGLTLWGIRPSILADGRQVKNLECFGSVKFDQKDLVGPITCSETGSLCLLGMQFLNQLGMDFTISPRRNLVTFAQIS